MDLPLCLGFLRVCRFGTLGFAGRDLASRAAPKSLSASVLGVYGFASIIVAGAAFALWSGEAMQPVGTQGLPVLLGAVLAGVFGYSSLMRAMRTGEVSAVTPFRYTRLLFGVGIGVLFFNETLSAGMVAGCALIVVSGLFIMWRGKAAPPPRAAS